MKFRELKTKSGIKLLLGRDASSNEELVERFKGKENTILHTASPGSPFCIIENLKPKRKEIKEGATACAKYSQDWRDNKNNVKVHAFTGKEVYKRKGMKLGTFGVRKKKIIRVRKRDIEAWKK